MPENRTPRYEMIDSRAGLEHLTRVLQNEKVIAVDLEADSMYHFKEKVCLLQMATESVAVVIDPLLIRDLSALKPLFKNRDIQKVFHGADYDIRSLFRDFQITINNLFDTQLACRFLGFEQTSLEAVLKKWYNVLLDKKYQRKDWSKRPLPAEMVAYAAEDVRYLVALAQRLESDLKSKGRLFWVYEECDHLSRVRPIANDADPLFLHFKGAGKLDPRSLAVLEALLKYRKKIARKKDKPLFKVIRNKSLMQLSVAKPQKLLHLEKTKALSPKQINMYGKDIVSTIQAALKLPANALPVYPRKKASQVPTEIGMRVKALRRWRNQQATRLKIDPALICTNAQINTIAVQNPRQFVSLSKMKEIKNWQKSTFGKDIIAVLGNAG